MIRSEFVIRNNKIQSFTVRGHAMSAPAPHDTVCAAVSAMTMLVINTVTDVFDAKIFLVQDDEKPLISLTLESIPNGFESAVQGVLRGFYLQLQDLALQVPENLSVRTKE